MRISTSWMYQQSLNTMMSQESSVAESQNEVSSGQAVNVASDNPIGAAQIVELNHVLASDTNYGNSSTSANTRLSVESSTLTTVANLLNNANDLGLSSMDGTLGQSDLQGIASQLEQVRQQLLGLANTTDANGAALFSGTTQTTTPFTLDNTGNVIYNGNDQQAYAAVGPGVQIPTSDTGASVFMNIPTGNGTFTASASSANTGDLIVQGNDVTDPQAWNAALAASPTPGSINDTITFGAAGAYTVTDSAGNTVSTGNYSDGDSIAFDGISITMSGVPSTGDAVNVTSNNATNTQSIFTTLNNMIGALQNDSPNSAQLENTMNRQLEALNQGIDVVSATQVSVGTRMDTVQQQQTSYSDLSITYQSALSSVQNVNMAQAISTLSLQTTALQASQEAFAKVQNLSLFNYLQP